MKKKRDVDNVVETSVSWISETVKEKSCGKTKSLSLPVILQEVHYFCVKCSSQDSQLDWLLYMNPCINCTTKTLIIEILTNVAIFDRTCPYKRQSISPRVFYFIASRETATLDNAARKELAAEERMLPQQCYTSLHLQTERLRLTEQVHDVLRRRIGFVRGGLAIDRRRERL